MIPNFYKLRIDSRNQETHEAFSISFSIPSELIEEFQFIQGQHLTLRCWIAKKEIRRSYSICSGINEKSPTITIKTIKNGLFSSWAKKNLWVGTEIDVLTPQGGFFTPLEYNNKKKIKYNL